MPLLPSVDWASRQRFSSHAFMVNLLWVLFRKKFSKAKVYHKLTIYLDYQEQV
jgi:hypothetical protein